MVELFNLIKIILDYLFTFFTLPIAISSSLGAIQGFISSVALAMHPAVNAFVTPYMTIIFLISLILPLLRDIF